MLSLRQYSYPTYEDVPIQARAVFTLDELVESKTCPDPRYEVEKLFGRVESPPKERGAFPWVRGRRPCDAVAEFGNLKRRARGLRPKRRKLRKGSLKAKLRAAR